MIIWSLDTFLMFPRTLQSWGVCQLVRQLVYTVCTRMLISNNHRSFYSWWKKNLVKHQKVSRYCGNDCSNLQYTIVTFTFSVFKRKGPFWQNLVKKKIKIDSFSCNLVPRELNVRVHFFIFLTRNNFFGQMCSKNSKCLFKVKFDT